jgi:hypothetical protein
MTTTTTPSDTSQWPDLAMAEEFLACAAEDDGFWHAFEEQVGEKAFPQHYVCWRSSWSTLGSAWRPSSSLFPPSVLC